MTTPGSPEEKQSGPQTEGLKGPNQGEKEEEMKPKLIIEPKMVLDEEDGHKTPTWPGNQIPATLKCPPPPRKKRALSSHIMRRRRSSEAGFRFFEETNAEELELFFQAIHEFARANKRRRSV